MMLRAIFLLSISFASLGASDCKKMIPLIVEKCPFGKLGQSVGAVRASAYKKGEELIVLYAFKKEVKAILIAGQVSQEIHGTLKGKTYFYENGEYRFICSKTIHVFE